MRYAARILGFLFGLSLKSNAAPSTDEKCKLMEARITALQELVW
jgi:hypothetical protein